MKTLVKWLRIIGSTIAILVLLDLGMRFLGPKPPVPKLTPELLTRLHMNPHDFRQDKISIRIEKSRYRLTLFYGNQPVKSYPVVFGGDPVNDKRMEGDKRTPEGRFKVRELYPHRTWSYFIWLDYPTADSWRKHQEAKTRGEIPQSAAIGGEIGIHGSPVDAAVDLKTNWTLGCVSMKNGDIAEIYPLTQAGTPVEIMR
ncbi:MAG TPA: L,D-transpeptidase [Coleofasciculaceae cyanobacterium]|jgi:murein L,D-transpeptidase YafK